MSLFRQGGRFLVAGGVQLLLDWALFVALTAAGVAAAPANLCGRLAGALLGFVLHGRYTFAGQRAGPADAGFAGASPGAGGSKEAPGRLGTARFLRYALAWSALTALSTLLVTLVADQAGLRFAWLAKPAVEAGMAVLSFFVWRHWVYR